MLHVSYELEKMHTPPVHEPPPSVHAVLHGSGVELSAVELFNEILYVFGNRCETVEEADEVLAIVAPGMMSP